MKPKYYFTLGGDLGDHQISEPEGWASIIFNLERDLTYWSLIENFEAPLIFYGIAEGKDGGYNYISSAKNAGPDTLVTLDIQISFDGGITRELCFDGRVDVSTAKETVYRAKIEAAIVRNDLWSVFMANKSTPVDIFSTSDIYGNSRYPINRQALNMPSQKIIKTYNADFSQGFEMCTANEAITLTGKYLQFDFDEEVTTEFGTKYSIPFAVNTTIPVNLFDIEETSVDNSNVDIVFEVSIFHYHTAKFGGSSCSQNITYEDPSSYLDFYFQKNNETPIAFSKTNFTSGGNTSTRYTFDQSVQLTKGDQITLYATSTNIFTGSSDAYTLIIYGKSPSVEVNMPTAVFVSGGGGHCDFDYGIENIFTTSSSAPSGNAIPSYINISMPTVFQDTECDSVLLHDAGLSICDRILGKDDSFYSEFLGGQYTSIRYPSNGCGYLNSLTRGKNIRGYSFSEKPFTISFDDYWNGINPVFNLGLGYEQLGNSPSSTVIRIENKSGFFDSTPSVYLTAINDIITEFDLNIFTKTIEIGFEQWQAESASGIDDPQTKHTYALRYKLFGKDEKQLSKFIAASLAIEQGRRLTKVQSNDWRLDENIFLIALQEQDTPIYPETSPPTITQQPEVFVSGVSGINNSNTRYNVRHTPARMLNRWIQWYSGQMQNYTSDQFKYQSGEGNVNMSWNGDGACDNGTLTENQNQNVSSDFVFAPIVYSFVHPLSWDQYRTIRDNRKKAISISWIDPQGETQIKIAFIKKLGFDINKSKGTFEVWIKDAWFSFDGLAFSDAFEI